MGNDGGTIARGKDLQAIFGAEAARNAENTHEAELVCLLTSLPLSKSGKSERVAADYKGNLFLKKQLLEALLAKSLPLALSHIKSLKDIADVSVHFDTEDNIVCPVSSAKRTKHFPFCYLRTCGCVIACKVLGELRHHLHIDDTTEEAAESECPQCSGKFMFNYDVVIINPHSKKDIDLNERNYVYLIDTLRMTHSKTPLKRKSDKSDKSSNKKRKTKKIKPDDNNTEKS